MDCQTAPELSYPDLAFLEECKYLSKNVWCVSECPFAVLCRIFFGIYGGEEERPCCKLMIASLKLATLIFRICIAHARYVGENMRYLALLPIPYIVLL